MIRPAVSTDLYAVLEAVPPLVAAMNAVGNDQWSAEYPVRSDFLRDIEAGTLFVDEEDGRLRGFAALDLAEPAGYQDLPWTVKRPALVVHRLAVAPGFQRRGVAAGLVAFAEDRTRHLGLSGLKSDTSDLNAAMNALFAKRGWRLVGSLRFDDAQVGFRAWEKTVR